jgi:hypothetical protein
MHAAFGAGILVLAIAVSANALGDARHSSSLRFNTPFALPGVTLPPGTYIFERADPLRMDLVRILSQDRSKAYLTAFTQLVERPKGIRADRQVSFAEVPRGLTPPITAWYPIGDSVGHLFIYPIGSPQLTGRAGN